MNMEQGKEELPQVMVRISYDNININFYYYRVMAPQSWLDFSIYLQKIIISGKFYSIKFICQY